MDSENGLDTGNGNQTNPLKTFEGLNQYLSSHGLMDCHLHLSLAEGVYNDPNLPNTLSGLSIEPDTTSKNAVENTSNISILVSASSHIFYATTGQDISIIIRGVSFHPSSVPDSQTSAGSLLTLTHSFLKLEHVEFIGFRRNSSLISSNLQSQIEARGVTAIDNECFKGGYQTANGAVFGGLSGSLTITDSIFELNRVVYQPPALISMPGLTSAGVVSSYGNLVLNGTVFRSNSVQLLLKDSHTMANAWACGGAVMSRGHSTIINGCEFNSNFVAANDIQSQQTIGGAICISSDGIFNITKSSFIGNQAWIGGAISDPPPELLFGPSSYFMSITSSTFVQNRCHFRGCAISLSPTLKFHLFLSNSTFDNNMLVRPKIHDESISGEWDSFEVMQKKLEESLHNLSLSAPAALDSSEDMSEFKPSIDSGDLTGGAALAVVVQRSSLNGFGNTKVVLSDVIFTNQTEVYPKFSANHGLALVLRKLDVVIMERVQFLNHSSHSSLSIVEIREAKSMYLGHLTLAFNNNYDLVLADKIQVILDITGSITSWPSHYSKCDPDYSTPEADQDNAQQPPTLFAWTITNLVLEHNTAHDAIVSITNAPSLLFEDSQWSGNSPPQPQSGLNRITSLVSFTGSSTCVVLRNIHVSHTWLPVSMSYLSGTTYISTCLFAYFQDANSNALRLRDIHGIYIKNTTFRENLGTPISSTATGMQLEHAKFHDNRSSFGPGAVEVTSGYISAEDSEFLRNIGLDGGAISSTNTVNLVRSKFQDNKARNGGAIHTIASKGIYLLNVTCEHNQASNKGGCLFYGAQELTSPYPTPDARFLQMPSLSIKGSQISRNKAQTGAALSLSGCIGSTTTGSSFSFNIAEASGGAVDIQEGPLVNSNGQKILRSRDTSCPHRFENCKFSSNFVCPPSIDGPARQLGIERPTHLGLNPRCSGGALNVQNTQIDVTGSDFISNWAGSFGGAIFALNSLRAFTSIVDSTFISNKALSSGGAVAVVESDLMLSSGNHSCEMLFANSTLIFNNARYGGAFTWAPARSCKIDGNHDRPSYQLMNLVVESNFAIRSGGAVYVDLPSPNDLYHYDNITFTQNSAGYSGGTFFLNTQSPGWKPNYLPPVFCARQRCSVTPITTAKKAPLESGYPPPVWGPIQASSSWRAMFDRDSIASKTFSVGSLTIGVTFFDLFNQQALEDVYSYSSVAPSVDPHLASMGSLEPGNWTNSALTLTMSVKKALARYPPAAWAPDEVSPFTSPVHLQGLISLFPVDYGGTAEAFQLESITDVEVNVTVFRCPRGQGLWPTPTNPELFACVPCPLGTYNIVEDGQCYSCQGRRGESYEVSCQQDNVTYSAGFWTSDLATTLKSNELFITKCDPIHCSQGGCVQGRTGLLCGSCQEDHWETLFAYCGQFCERPNILFLVTLAIFLLIATCTFHYFIQNHPLPTMHICTIGTMGMIILGPALDWSLPTFLPTIASFFCGFRANSIQRALFLSAFPYASLVVLLLLSILKLVKLGRITRIFKSFSSGLPKSAFGILLILAIPSMKHAVGWVQCTATPLGKRWSLGPEFSCDITIGTISLVILLAISLVPILLACIIVASSFAKRPIDLLGFSTILINENARKPSRVAFIVDLLARLAISIVFSATYHHINTRAVVIGGIMLTLFVGNTLAPLFTSALQQAALSISYGALVVLSITEPVLYLSKSYPVIAFGLFSTWCIALVVVLAFGHRAPSLVLDYNWEVSEENQQ